MREIQTGAESAARQAVMTRAITALQEAPGVLLLGPPGIGRSHLLEQLVEHGRTAGVRVLRCAPVEAELPLPFMCLIDLLDAVPDQALEQLPAGQRNALRAALLRGDDRDAEPGGARVPLAVLTLLRGFAARGPVWLVVDDLQWVDEPTARVLGFVARRTAGTALRFLATEPVAADRAPSFAGLCPPGTVRLAVPPLTPAELAAVLDRHAEAPLPPATVREVCRAAQGNPRYALEIARSLPPQRQAQPAPLGGALPGPLPGLPGLLAERLQALPEEVREALVLASAAARPDVTLLATAGGPSVTLHLETAERLGVVRIAPDGHVHFDNPLLRTAVYAEASGRSRRAAHARLAAAATEPVERARHLALAHPARDEDTARTLMVAAASARRRGAPATAAELSALAVARTPVEAADARIERRLAAAGYAVDAGRWDTARGEARSLLREEHCPEVRVRARIVLLRCAGNALETEGPLIEQGLAEAAAAGSPGLEAQLRCWDSTRDLLAGRIGRATAEARRAAALAERAGEPETLLEALTSLAYLQRLSGDPEAEATLARALAGAGRHGIGDVRLWECLMTEGIFHLHANRLAQAESAMLEALRRFGEQVGVEELMDMQIHLADVRIRSGDCAGALRAARHAAALHADLAGPEGAEGPDAAEAGGADGAGPVAYVTAAAESVGGSLERARRIAERGARVAERDGDRFWRLWNLTVLGRVHLMADEPAQAAEVLREVREIERAMGIVDPGIGRWHADLAEALVGEGTPRSLAEARSFIDEVAPVARRLGRTAVLGCLERADALLRLARGCPAEAAELLESAVARLRPEGVPLELARALAARAEAERRRRRQAAARRAADEAVRICREAGAAAWHEPIERRAHGGVRPVPVQQAAHVSASSSLTPSEQRIAALAADGATNREIAAACFLSVKTVEASLSRVYRKLGVRSRTELAKTLSG